MIVKVIICLVVGYLFGCISTAYIIGRLNHIDIRSYGSGNAGATNILRTLGKLAGIFTYVGDALKTIIPVLAMGLIFQYDMKFNVIALITGFGVVLGHNYPFWLGFKGGKGIAVTSAVILLYNPVLVSLYIGVFAAIVILTRYVSLGSLIVAVMFLVQILITGFGNMHYGIQIVFGILFCFSAFYMHRTNIIRLLNGNENKITLKK